MEYGLYIHIPFCRQKCFYCDFPSYAGMEALQEPYLAALEREIAGRGGILTPGDVIDTVYLGGGTPTVLPGEAIEGILAAIRRHFALAAAAEVTIEANPGTVGEEKLARLCGAGVNRISFGVQGFQDALLRKAGRLHTAAQAVQAVRLADAAGFKNISVDLMYGLPGQAPADLRESLAEACRLGVQHISVYGLKVEEGTPFAEKQRQGTLCLPSDKEEAAMYEYIADTLPERGYERYEISNYALPGFRSRHNLKYWQNKPYIGLGAAAHSYYQRRRLANVEDPAEYIARINGGRDAAHLTEFLDDKALIEEFCFLALRTKEGIDAQAFENLFACNIFQVYGDIINKLSAKGLLDAGETHVCLTRLGMKYGNQVFCEFLLD